MTNDQWHADATLRPQLAELLNHPVMLRALAMVRDGGLKPIVPIANCDLIQYGAMTGFKRDGYFEAIRNLLDLARVHKKKAPDQEPWKTEAPAPEIFEPDKVDPLPVELKPQSQPAEPQAAAAEPPQPKL